MGLNEELGRGWQDHADNPEGVSARFDALLEQVGDPKELPRVAGLFTHVDGEHLGAWDRAIARVDQLLAWDGVEGPVAGSLRRSRAAMSLCAGDPSGLGAHEDPSHRARILAVAAAAAAGQGRVGEAGRWFSDAIEHADGVDDGDPAIRSLAITGNNLAVELEQKAARSEAQDALMLDAATAARRYWALAGTWSNVKIAEYRLAMTCLALGRWEQALDHADAAVALCDANEAGPDDWFFAHEARSRALHAGGRDGEAHEARDRAAACLAGIEDEGFRGYCEGELTGLDTLLG